MIALNKRIRRLLLWCGMAVCLSACNNDVFVDRITGFGQHIDMAVDDTYSIEIPLEGLENVYAFCEHDYNSYMELYDRDGNLLPGDSPSEIVAKVIYGNPRFTLEAIVNGNIITFHLLDNTYDRTLPVTIGFNYGYAVETIELNLEPGQPMEAEIYYGDSKAQTEFRTKRLNDYCFTNNSSITQYITYSPYRDTRTSVLLHSDYDYINGLQITSPIPEYNGSEWDFTHSPEAQLQFGSYAYFVPDNSSESINVEVPPNSTAWIKCSIIYACLKIPYLGTVTQPNSGRSWPADGNCIVSQPVNYDLNVEIK